jgi:hypothetical protein
MLTLGYDLDKWNAYNQKVPIQIDISATKNKHTLISGMSESGKTYAEQAYIAKKILAEPTGEYWFADYKGDDTFEYLRGYPRYRSFKSTLEALDAVYNRLNARMSGADDTRNPVTLIWDEYMANMLALINEDKKLATATMNKVSEILLMGRSMNISYVCSVQRPDAVAFPVGSRLNYGIILVVGAFIRSVYEMVMPDHIEQVEGRVFNQGEGAVLLQGTRLHFIKILVVQDYDRVQNLLKQALSQP